ncbi:putative Transcription factor [Quillaja saponaria]|uniref:Transcription factor n=1 Tax=Quillaja saponaria TaxID=32244 RepID=A0AAD7PUC1_QUISA|nr:putative Transcription factor [Quillaja saponaria]
MGEKVEFGGGDHLTEGTSFSELLFGDDDGDSAVGFDVDQRFQYSPAFPTDKTPKMLCFGDYKNQAELLLSETKRKPQKSVITCSDSFSAAASTCNNSSTINTLFKPNKKRNGSGQEPVQSTSSVTVAKVASQRTSKKAKAENPSPAGHSKRKEKLGERILALQQLVSPFGKTDTASVLHEAMGYIRFLHDQVQVLCSPYLQRLHCSPDHQQEAAGQRKGGHGEEAKKDLRSKGLCLIPVECTVHVANSNGADFWSPAMGNNISSSLIAKQ